MALDLPVVNGSSGTWGTILNTALTDLDNRLTTATTKNNDQDTTLGTLDTRIDTLEANSASGKLTVVNGSYPALSTGQVFLDTTTGYLSYVVSINGTLTRVPFPGSFVAKLKATSTRNYGNNSSGPIVWSAADTDRLSGWNASNNTRYTASIAGAYEFTGAISYATNATGYRSATWYVNGVAQNSSAAVVAAANGEATVVVARPVVLSLTAGSYVELHGLQNSGVTLTTDVTTAFQPSMSVKYLGYNA